MSPSHRGAPFRADLYGHNMRVYRAVSVGGPHPHLFTTFPHRTGYVVNGAPAGDGDAREHPKHEKPCSAMWKLAIAMSIDISVHL